jgi:hypothetical protein
MSTESLLSALHDLEEAPWAELVAGKPLNARGLARRLGTYGVKSKVVRLGERTPRGYAREDFADAWARYLPDVAPVAHVADAMGDRGSDVSSSRIGSATSATRATEATASEQLPFFEAVETCRNCGAVVDTGVGYCADCDPRTH